MKRFLTLLMVLVLISGCGASSSPENSSEKTEEVKQEKKVGVEEEMYAPDFTLEDLSGEEHTLSDYRGKVVLVDFWATYCKPCRDEIPHFVDFYEKYREDSLVILGVGVDGKKNLQRFSENFDVNYPILVDNKDIATEYEIRGVPTTFILDRDGKITKKVVGYAPTYEDTLENAFKKLLEKE